MLTQVLLSLALLGGDSPNAVTPTWKIVEQALLRPQTDSEPERKQRFVYELRISETDICAVSLLEGNTGIHIRLTVTRPNKDKVSQKYECHVRLMRARLLNEKKEVVILFYDTQPKKGEPALPLDLFEPFKKYADSVPNAEIQWLLSHYPDKLEAPSVLVTAKPREHAKSDLQK